MLWRSLTQRGVSGAMALAVVSTAVATFAAPGGVHAEVWPQGASIATTTTLSSSQNPSQLGDAVTFTATVTASVGGAPITAGTVAFTDTAAGTLGTGVLDANGRASFSTSTLSGGSHSIVAAFAGDSSVAPSAGSLSQEVVSSATDTTLTSSSNPSLLGASVTFTATVVFGGGPVTGGDVTFLLDSAVLETVPVTDGVATFTAPGGSLAAGSHVISASFNGTTGLETSGAELTQQVNERPPDSVTLTSSLNPSRFGDPVTFTATVTFLGGPYSGGLLRFTADGVPLAGPPGGITPDANGQGSLTTSMLAAGSHQIVASFTPNGNNFVDSASLTQQVSEAPTTTSTTTTTAQTTTIPVSTTTTPTSSTSTTAPGRVDTLTELSSSLNPSVVGQPVTFTATVAPVGGSERASLRSRSGAPFPRQVADGGTLTISDGDTVLAVVPVGAGRGAFTTSSLSPGTHTITAAFSGTVTDEPSSATLTQQVDQAAQLPATR